MHTMVQDANNDYDIDDGVYFTEDQIDGKSPKRIRDYICEKLGDDRFNKQPKSKKSCVRIFYNEGYHVDMPIYRIRKSDGEYELAAGDNWVVSRAADVEKWFSDTNQAKSPDQNNGRQFRRIVRMLKKFARSRVTWKDEIAAGFTITVLAAEKYASDLDREDVSLRSTMQKIYARLCWSLEVGHPVTPGAMLTSGPQDLGTSYLKDRLKEALDTLSVLDEEECTREKALSAWDKVFNASFFKSRFESEKSSTAENAQKLATIFSSSNNPPSVDKQGGGRFA